jgi:hypothetical protein
VSSPFRVWGRLFEKSGDSQINTTKYNTTHENHEKFAWHYPVARQERQQKHNDGKGTTKTNPCDSRNQNHIEQLQQFPHGFPFNG